MIDCCKDCPCAKCPDRADKDNCGVCLVCDFGSMRPYVEMCDREKEKSENE